MVTVSIHHGDFVYYFTFYCNFTINSYCECNAFRFFVTIWCGCFCQSIVTRLQTYLMSIRFIFSIGRPLCYYLITFCEGQGSSVEFVASHIGLADNYVMVTVFVHHCNCTYGFSIYFYISFFVYNKDDAFGFFVTVWCCGFCQSVSSRIKLYFMVFSFFRSPALHLLILIIGYCKLCAGNFISGNIHFFNDYFAIRIIVCHDDFFHCSIIYGYGSVDSYIKGNIGCNFVATWCFYFNQCISTRLQAEFFYSSVGGPAFYQSSVFICYFKPGSRKLSSRHILLADFYCMVTISIHHGDFTDFFVINCYFAVVVYNKGDRFSYFVTIWCCGFCQSVGSRLQAYRMAVWLCRCVRCPLLDYFAILSDGQLRPVKFVASHVGLSDDYVHNSCIGIRYFHFRSLVFCYRCCSRGCFTSAYLVGYFLAVAFYGSAAFRYRIFSRCQAIQGKASIGEISLVTKSLIVGRILIGYSKSNIFSCFSFLCICQSGKGFGQLQTSFLALIPYTIADIVLFCSDIGRNHVNIIRIYIVIVSGKYEINGFV